MTATAGSLAVRITASIDDFQKNLTKAERTMMQFGNSLASAGRTMTIGLTAPLLAAGVGMAKLAADAEESASKFQAVFGKNARAMDQWIREVRRTIPQTTQQLRDVTSSVQALLVPMGMSQQAAIDLGKSFAVLGADLASFYNMPVQEALTALRSGLVGEYEPLRRFGVALSAATVEQEAFRLGLIKNKDELTAGIKAQAAWSIILRSTTMAQGDAARTANSTANQLKFARANAEEAAATFGMLLTPALGGVARFMANLGASIAAMDESNKRLIVGIAGVAAAIGPLTWAVGGMISGFVKLKGVVTGLSAVLGMAGLAGNLIVGGALLTGLALLGVFIHRSGEEARKAKAQLEQYKGALAGLEASGLKTHISAKQSERSVMASALANAQSLRNALPNGGLVRRTRSDIGDLRTPEARRLDAEITRLTNNIKTIDAQLSAAREQERAMARANAEMEAAAEKVRREMERLAATTGTAKDTLLSWAEAHWSVFRNARFGQPMTDGRWAASGINHTGALAIAVDGRVQSGFNVPRNANGLAPLSVDMSSADEEIRKVVEEQRAMKNGIVTELQKVPAAIAQSLAGFLGPVFARMGAGGATGGMLGATIGTALGTGAAKQFLGAKAGGVLGSLFGPIGGIAGGFIGAGVGSLVGKLFGGHKDKADQSAAALDRLRKTADRVSESLSNIPQGFKVARARYVAAKAETMGGGDPNNPLPTGTPQGGEENGGGGVPGGGVPGGGVPGGGVPGGGVPGGGVPLNAVVIQNLNLVARDADDMLQQLQRKAEQQAMRGGGRGLSLAMAGAIR